MKFLPISLRRGKDKKPDFETGYLLSKRKYQTVDVVDIGVCSKATLNFAGKPTPKSELIRVLAVLKDDDVLDDLQYSANAYFEKLGDVLAALPASMRDLVKTISLVDESAAGVEVRLYEVLFAVATLISDENQQQITIRKMCMALEDQELVTGDVEKVAQLVFVLFGALTMLYTPVPDPKPHKLQMRSSDLRHLVASSTKQLGNLGCRSTQRRPTATWRLSSQDLTEETLNSTLDDLLCHFCNSHLPIPVPRIQPHSQSHAHQVDQRVLKSQNVSYYSLANLLNVKLEWTASICEHLEFNLRKKTVKLFNMPSFCFLLCALEPEKTFLDVLFRKFLQDQEDQVLPADFFREILSTYRILFGQHEDSRKLIQVHCEQGRFLGHQFKTPHPSSFFTKRTDPLLYRLCFEDCRDEPLFIQLDMFDLKNTYNLDTDFPYFAERLSTLQDFVENQCPNDWKILWRDRRDVAKFWTIWAVILFGLPTLVLAIIQTILTGLQLHSK